MRPSRKKFVEDGLGWCDIEIGVDCALVSFSKGLGMPDARAVSSCWGGSWGVVLKYTPKQRLTHDF